MRRNVSVASCGLLIALCVVACSGSSPVPTTDQPVGRTEPGAGASDAVRSARGGGEAAAEVDATVVVEGSYGSDFTFCRQRGSIGVRLVRQGDRLRGDFSGPAPSASADQESCDDEQEMTGHWEIDVSVPGRPDVVACEVNGRQADTSTLLSTDSGVEVECTRAGAQDGMLVETTFVVDL